MTDISMIASDLEREVWCLLGLPIDATDMAGTIARLDRSLEECRPCFLSTPNLNFLIASLDDPFFRRSVVGSDWVIADGMPLIWLARLLGLDLRERVPGSGMIEQLRARGKERSMRVFLFGGLEGVAESACDLLQRERGGLECVGALNPGFGSIEEMSSEQIIDTINSAAPDFVIVSLGAKRGQAWIMRNQARLNAPLISHLGAVVNFIAGTVARAPGVVQSLGLEWLWRIYEEPGLFSRYWRDGTTLLRLLFSTLLPHRRLMARLKRGRQPGATLQIGEERGGDGETRLLLSGDACIDNLPRLRAVLPGMILSSERLVIDIGGLDWFDGALSGLLLLVDKQMAVREGSLTLLIGSDWQRMLLRYSRLEFLIDGEDGREKVLAGAL